MLGYPREALQLATTGRHGLSRAYSPACASRLFALQAGAHAALGDTTAAVRAVVESERAFEHIDTDAEPEWARFIDNAYLSGEWANTFADLQRPVESTRFGVPDGYDPHQIFSNAFLDLIRSWPSLIGRSAPG